VSCSRKSVGLENEMIVETTIAVVCAIATVLSTLYARHAYKSSVKAPLLKVELMTTNGHPVDIPEKSSGVAIIILRPSDFLKPKCGKANRVTLKFSIVVRNSGTLSAKSLRLRIRYSSLFGVMLSSNGEFRDDADRPNWIVVEHKLPDLHPRQSHTIESDHLVPHEKWLKGMDVAGKASTRNGHMVNYKLKAWLEAWVEFVLYAEDVEPVYRECCFKLEQSDCKVE